MIDINKTIDLLKIKFYNEWLYTSHVSDEGESEFHREMTKEVISKYIDPLNLPKSTKILDLGCGPGYFLDVMKDKGYTDLVGVTLSEGDLEICKQKGHETKQLDMSFLPHDQGFHDESADFIFLRHALEHSPYPIFTLMEHNRVLKQNGKIYIEVPSPACERVLENISNHYSIFEMRQLIALLNRTGFTINKFDVLDVEIGIPDENKEVNKYKEVYYCVTATKTRPLDIK